MKILTHPTLALCLINLAIVGMVAAAIYWTKEPLCMMGLLLLQAVPVIGGMPDDEDDDDEPTIGFTAKP